MHASPISIRLPAVMAAFGYGSEGAVYNLINEGCLPAPVKIGKASAWPVEEVRAVVTAYAGGATNEQLRALVRRLTAKRAADWEELQTELGLTAA